MTGTPVYQGISGILHRLKLGSPANEPARPRSVPSSSPDRIRHSGMVRAKTPPGKIPPPMPCCRPPSCPVCVRSEGQAASLIPELVAEYGYRLVRAGSDIWNVVATA